MFEIEAVIALQVVTDALLRINEEGIITRLNQRNELQALLV